EHPSREAAIWQSATGGAGAPQTGPGGAPAGGSFARGALLASLALQLIRVLSQKVSAQTDLRELDSRPFGQEPAGGITQPRNIVEDPRQKPAFAIDVVGRPGELGCQTVQLGRVGAIHHAAHEDTSACLWA